LEQLHFLHTAVIAADTTVGNGFTVIVAVRLVLEAEVVELCV
jgi:hypothetical protein